MVHKELRRIYREIDARLRPEQLRGAPGALAVVIGVGEGASLEAYLGHLELAKALLPGHCRRA